MSGLVALGGGPGGGPGNCGTPMEAGRGEALVEVAYAEVFFAAASSPPGLVGTKPGLFGCRIVFALDIPGIAACAC
jgi:hypothetical protein